MISMLNIGGMDNVVYEDDEELFRLECLYDDVEDEVFSEFLLSYYFNEMNGNLSKDQKEEVL